MGTRVLRFGLYADTEGLAGVAEVVDREVACRAARVTDWTVVRAADDPSLAQGYDFLAEQWAIEHPGGDGGGWEAAELHVRLVCSLRTYRALRKAVIRGLCPEGAAPHTCRVPWSAW
ncbi:hypothetical protein [Streptomyces sp. Isolate_45]|uniref:hypothetical protein n=1 Tax=Streptomyces sp. Isolate_45 TaxID=2950111 RepID=UPI002481A3AF|nr:hypothetical protein [Streptomyces sp. Isolate_45]MDA5280220.1 hypothetical protein [Streptomyces sp. Isolate_45]